MDLLTQLMELILALLLTLLGIGGDVSLPQPSPDLSDPPALVEVERRDELDPEDLPRYHGTPYALVGDNVPDFTQEELERLGEEEYAPLDELGRCGAAFAVVGPETMPTEERGAIGQIKPSGWRLAKYDCVEGKYLYNRCHLIGYQLAGENANRQNLITGTRYLNVEGMLPFENDVARYVEDTGCHVAYRATPVFVENELLARGVRLEGWSVEDRGEGICFDVFIFNVQPGVELDYATGENWLTE